MGSRALWAAAVAAGAACAPAVSPHGDSTPARAPARIERHSAPNDAGAQDIVSTALDLNVTTFRGEARIELRPSPSGEASLEVGGLAIDSVVATPDSPAPLVAERVDRGRLALRFAPGTERASVDVTYAFAPHDHSDGFDRGRGSTMLWPYWCGRVFPCDSHPADGVRFTLRLRGVPEGRTAVYPSEIRFDAPPYMLAFAVGEYVREELGRTRAGTRVSVWYFPNDAELARRGTSGLVSAIDFLERTYGPYRFGGSVGSVEANWRGLSAGAMEHHPFWHVTRASLDDQETHIHEAAHGWFGNGVRIRCWEDFVLSEGVASYLAVRAIESTRGAAEGEAIWRSYRGRLARVVRGGDTAAWPRGCNRIDILHHRLWSDIPYMKGAFFLRDVAERVGRARLDAALARFYAERVGTAAGFDDLLDTIRRETHFDPEPLVSRWLR